MGESFCILQCCDYLQYSKENIESFFISYNLVVLSQNNFFSGFDFVRKKRFHSFPIFCPEVCWGVLSYPLFLLRVVCRKWLPFTRQCFGLRDTW